MNYLLDPCAHAAPEEPAPEIREFYLRCLALLDRADIPYMVGGGYAVAYYTGITRHTKDLDLFLRPADRDRALRVLAEEGGYRTDITWPHFLAKALHGDAFVDLIYRSGNGLCEVDGEWFRHAVHAEVWGYPVQLCPPEETLWSKAYVQDRDRFDGGDINHLLLRQGESFDWRRLLRRFRGHERLLLAHLFLFSYTYPRDRERVLPDWVMTELLRAAEGEAPADEPVCRGTLIAKRTYLHDVAEWGFADPRLPPYGRMTPEDVAHFTAT
jgi:hypothetical protein